MCGGIWSNFKCSPRVAFWHVLSLSHRAYSNRRFPGLLTVGSSVGAEKIYEDLAVWFTVLNHGAYSFELGCYQAISPHHPVAWGSVLLSLRQSWRRLASLSRSTWSQSLTLYIPVLTSLPDLYVPSNDAPVWNTEGGGFAGPSPYLASYAGNDRIYSDVFFICFLLCGALFISLFLLGVSCSSG